MRGLGLVGLLVVTAIILLAYANYTSQIAKTNARIKPDVQQMAGVDTSGRRVSDSYSLKTLNAGSHLRGVEVTRLSPDSPMRTFYGLKENDIITEVGASGSMMRARDDNDGEMFKALIAEAYQTKQPLVVERDGKSITLKPGGGAAGDSNPAQILDDITKQK